MDKRRHDGIWTHKGCEPGIGTVPGNRGEDPPTYVTSGRTLGGVVLDTMGRPSSPMGSRGKGCESDVGAVPGNRDEVPPTSGTYGRSFGKVVLDTMGSPSSSMGTQSFFRGLASSARGAPSQESDVPDAGFHSTSPKPCSSAFSPALYLVASKV